MPTPADASEKTPMERLQAAAKELTHRRRHYAYLDYYDRKLKNRVRTRVDIGMCSLIELLEQDVERDDDTSPKQPGGLTHGFNSRPPGRYAPRELLAALNKELGVWLAWWGLDERVGPSNHVRVIVKIAPSAETFSAEAFHKMVRELEVWADRLREYAGLELTYRPRSTCPVCDKLGALTVRIDQATRQAERGHCAACKSNWDKGTVGILIEHIRGITRKVKGQRVHVTSTSPIVAAEECPRCGEEPAAIGNNQWHCVPCQLDLRRNGGKLSPSATQGAA